MRISILTFDAFNDLDSLVAFGMLSRITLLGDKDWQVRIASPTPRVTSMNGLTIDADEDLSQLAEARYPIYAEADLTVDVGGGSHGQAVEAIYRELRRHAREESKR